MITKYKDIAFNRLKESYLNKESNQNSDQNNDISREICASVIECMKSGISFEIDGRFIWLKHNSLSIPVSIELMKKNAEKNFEQFLAESEQEVYVSDFDLDVRESLDILRDVMKEQSLVIKNQANELSNIKRKTDKKSEKVPYTNEEYEKMKKKYELCEEEKKRIETRLEQEKKDNEKNKAEIEKLCTKNNKLSEEYEKKIEELGIKHGEYVVSLNEQHEDEIGKIQYALEKKYREENKPDEYYESLKEALRESENEKLLLETTNKETLALLEEVKQKYDEVKIYAYEDRKFNCRNANAFNLFFGENDLSEYSVAYVVLDTLDEINHKAGRDAGDSAIMTVRNELVNMFGYTSVYRVMGGHFYVFSDDKIAMYLKNLKTKLFSMGLKISYGFVQPGEVEDKYEIIEICERRTVDSSYRKNTNANSREKMNPEQRDESVNETESEDDVLKANEITVSYYQMSEEEKEAINKMSEEDTEESMIEDVQNY